MGSAWICIMRRRELDRTTLAIYVTISYPTIDRWWVVVFEYLDKFVLKSGGLGNAVQRHVMI